MPALPRKSEPLLMPLSRFLVSGEHPTKGLCNKLVKENKQHRLELDQDFSTSTSGPDLGCVLAIARPM